MCPSACEQLFKKSSPETGKHNDSWQGVRSSRNVCELLRFMKNHIQIYVPKCSRMYEKHLLNLLESSIPDISTYISIFSVGTLEKLPNYVMASTQNLTADFPVSKNRLIILSFPVNTFSLKCCLYPLGKKASALRKFKMARVVELSYMACSII